MKKFISKYIVIPSMAIMFYGCGSPDGSPSGNTVELPSSTDYELTLSCLNVGLGNEQCILDDNENPFKNVLVNNENKWTLNDSNLSAKSQFYLWGTALAHNPTGENQYYTALALHKLYTKGVTSTEQIGSANAKNQAKLAYRYLLDNYYDSVTYATRSAGDFIADTDFKYSDFSTGSQFNGSYTSDLAYSPVLQINAGSQIALLAFYDFSAGTIAKYDTFEFKIKNFPDDDITVKFIGDSEITKTYNFTTDNEISDISNKEGWKQVRISMNDFNNSSNNNTQLAISTSTNNGFLITDIAFSGDTTGNGLANDRNNDGKVYIYTTQTEQYAINLNNLAAEKIVVSDGDDYRLLYDTQEEANNYLNIWGYSYDTNTKKVSRN